MPFNISCGFWKNCETGFTRACLTLNPGTPAPAIVTLCMGHMTAAKPSTVPCPTGDFNYLVCRERKGHVKLRRRCFDRISDGSCRRSSRRSGRRLRSGAGRMLAAYSLNYQRRQRGPPRISLLTHSWGLCPQLIIFRLFAWCEVIARNRLSVFSIRRRTSKARYLNKRKMDLSTLAYQLR